MAINNRLVSGFDEKENARRGENSIRIGKIKEARYETEGHPETNDKAWFSNEDTQGMFRGALYRVEMGDHQCYWMPQLHQRAGNDLEYWALEVGEQVIVLAPAGDPMQGFIIGCLSQDAYRPPEGIDDKTKDKRPWRETVRRIRYQDGHLLEYDRELHRGLEVYPDGTRFLYWFKDERKERQKATDSDKTGGEPRHLQQANYADGAETLILWDEDNKTHRQHMHYADGTLEFIQWQEQEKIHQHQWTYPDGRIVNYHWDEVAQTHFKTTHQADGTIHKYHWQEGANGFHLHETIYSDGTVHRYHYDTPHHHQISYADGTVLTYDLTTHHLTAEVVGDASIHAQQITLQADNKIELSAPTIALKGNLSVDGNISATGSNPNHHTH